MTGIASVDRIVRNSTSRVGDELFLTKPIGNGILVCAYRALNTKRDRKHEPPDLDRFERAGTGDGPKAIAVRLHHREEWGARGGSYSAGIGDERGEVDLEPSARFGGLD